MSVGVAGWQLVLYVQYSNIVGYIYVSSNRMHAGDIILRSTYYTSRFPDKKVGWRPDFTPSRPLHNQYTSFSVRSALTAVRQGPRLPSTHGLIGRRELFTTHGLQLLSTLTPQPISVFVLQSSNGWTGVLNRPHLHFNWSTPLPRSRPDLIPFGTLLPLSRCTSMGLG